MKILSVKQVKEVDEITIQSEPISSINLMERAAATSYKRLIKLIKPHEQIIVVCGLGNNGGDGLAIGRMLIAHGLDCMVYVLRYSDKLSKDAEVNYLRLKEKYPTKLFDIKTGEEIDNSGSDRVLIDALLGTGTNKPAEGLLGEFINYCNRNFKTIISIDVPSGLFIDDSSADNKYIIQATLTLTFQMPKLAFLFAQNQKFVPAFEVLNIGIHPDAISKQNSNHYYITPELITSLLKPRSKFSHKGTYGHALLVAGSSGKSGAAIIAAKACLRSGAGLLTVHSTKITINGLLNQLPEAMSVIDSSEHYISEINHLQNYSALAFGPGAGTHEKTQIVLKKILNYYTGKLVLDADGLNTLSENKTWLDFLPPSTILTPHPKEFDRLTQKSEDDFERFKTLKKFALRYKCIVVLKGAHSAIAMPDGNVFFNSTGNPGLAKGGSGDALTGIILGLLSRGYNAPQAALIGTFIHGFAADLCVKKKSIESLLITDLIEQLPKAFKKLEM